MVEEDLVLSSVVKTLIQVGLDFIVGFFQKFLFTIIF